MKDFWSAAARQVHLQRLHAELGVQAIGKLTAENIPGVQVHDRNQIQESFVHRDVGDLVEVHQTGKALRRAAWNGRPWFLVDRP